MSKCRSPRSRQRSRCSIRTCHGKHIAALLEARLSDSEKFTYEEAQEDADNDRIDCKEQDSDDGLHRQRIHNWRRRCGDVEVENRKDLSHDQRQEAKRIEEVEPLRFVWLDEGRRNTGEDENQQRDENLEVL